MRIRNDLFENANKKIILTYCIVSNIEILFPRARKFIVLSVSKTNKFWKFWKRTKNYLTMMLLIILISTTSKTTDGFMAGSLIGKKRTR